MKKVLSLILAIVMIAATCVSAFAADEDIYVLFTNDVHTYIDNVYNAADEEKEAKLSYSKLAQMKKDMLAEGKNVLMADCGDVIQGTGYGGLDKGENIRKIFKAVGYDVATFGNHEFDYDMEIALDHIKNDGVPFLSCNFYDIRTGENVCDSYKIFEIGGKKIGFVGISTPSTISTSTPKYFKDENGEFIYGFKGGEFGDELYASVREAVDAVRAEGVDYVIAITHLGNEDGLISWRSADVIANTTGIDVLLDGHDHIQYNTTVKNKDGKDVLSAESGCYLGAVGVLKIAGNGEFSVEFVDSYAKEDSEVKALEENWINEVDNQLGEVIGYAEVTLDNYEGEERLARKQETNTGDFATDALCYYFGEVMGLDVDCAIMNGGACRNKAVTGPVSYKDCKTIHSFGNVACLITLKGRQILEALEYGAKDTPDNEHGGFLQVSGIRYNIHSYLRYNETTPETWESQDVSNFRVKDVEIYNKETEAWEALDLEKDYNLAGYNYTLREGGDSFYMFEDAVPVVDYVAQDYIVLATYLKSFPEKEQTVDGKTVSLPTVSDKYGDVFGEGRITLYTEQPQYTLTYDVVNEIAFAKYGESFTVGDFAPEQKGYKFLGWAAEEGAAEAQYVAGDTIEANGDMILYAVWQKTTNPLIFVGIAVVAIAAIVLIVKKKKK